MSANRDLIQVEFRAMGTDIFAEIIILSAADKERSKKSTEKIKEIFKENENIFSRFSGDSELSKINANLGREVKVSEKMIEILEYCLKFNKLSGGYFDPRIIENLEKIGYDKDFFPAGLDDKEGRKIKTDKIKGDLRGDLIINKEKNTVLAKKRIDTTGIAKGYTVGEVAFFLKREGWENFIVDAGGDMYAAGKNSENEKWKIIIEGLSEERPRIELRDEGVATSGVNRKSWTIGEKKFHHLINSKDPENYSFAIKTVTVISEKTIKADCWAKVLFLMGKEKGLQFADDNKIKALFLDWQGSACYSKNIREYIK
jgi:thiamine biosynthesis lipoprotein